MELLPGEILVHLLGFLPTPFLPICRTVCSRCADTWIASGTYTTTDAPDTRMPITGQSGTGARNASGSCSTTDAQSPETFCQLQ